jgi:putative hemolysin
LLYSKNLRVNVNTAHKYVLHLSTWRAELPIILGFVHFKMYLRGDKMRVAFLVGCAALLLSACSSNDEPVQQATAAHVSPGMRAAMSSTGQANCAMVGGSLSVARQLDGSAIGMCALPNGKRCSEQALAGGSCGNY